MQEKTALNPKHDMKTHGLNHLKKLKIFTPIFMQEKKTPPESRRGF